jgi:hypothetical protein
LGYILKSEVKSMSDTELLVKEVQSLPPGCLQEVLDFVGYLRQKYAQDDTGDRQDHAPNAVTLAAMQEVQDMIDGKIPANRYHSLDEMLDALHS